MAKKSLRRRNESRYKICKSSLTKRESLLKKSKNRSLTLKERLDSYLKLTDLPKNGSSIRIRNRCNLTGRPRGNLRKFGVSRIALRDLALWGQIPGLIKSSW